MYLVKLLFWMLLAPVGVIVLFGLIRVWMHFTMRFTWREFGERALSLGVRLLFLFYPIISTIAFEAFACHEFEGIDKWLIVASRSTAAASITSARFISSLGWLLPSTRSVR